MTHNFTKLEQKSENKILSTSCHFGSQVLPTVQHISLREGAATFSPSEHSERLPEHTQYASSRTSVASVSSSSRSERLLSSAARLPLRKHIILFTFLLLAFLLGMSDVAWGQTKATNTITSGSVYTTSGDYVAPTGYRISKIECWGGGGDGWKSGDNWKGGTGGGGGGYVATNVTNIGVTDKVTVSLGANTNTEVSYGTSYSVTAYKGGKGSSSGGGAGGTSTATGWTRSAYQKGGNGGGAYNRLTGWGESRSDSIEHVLQNIEKIHAEGLKEVNITGVNLGTFGKGTDENFYDLLKAIDRQHLVERVRISSIEPNLLTDEIIHLVSESDILMPHFHIPLQSGSDKILAAMKRRYKTDLFASKISKIKQLMPDACIAIDIIAGFPGETDSDFEDSYEFVKQLPLSYMHVFTYSRRPGTPAAAIKEQVPETVKRERTNRLLELSETKKRFFYHEHFGETRPVLWESEEADGKMFGFTDNYIKVSAPFCADWVNTIRPYVVEDHFFN